MSSILYTMEQMARRDTDIQRVRSIMKAGARILTRAGIPTTVRFGKATGARRKKQRGVAQANVPGAKGHGPSGKATSGKRRGKALRRGSDGVAYSDGLLSDVQLPTVLEYTQDVRDVRDVRDEVPGDNGEPEDYVVGDVR